MSTPDPSAQPKPAAAGPQPAAPKPAQPVKPPERERRDVGFWIGLLLGLVVLAYLIGLLVDNSRRVRVGWVFGHGEASLVWIVVIAAIAGFLLGIATLLLYQRGRRRARAAAKKP